MTPIFDKLSDADDVLGKVIAPLFVIQRVANGSALTKNTVASGRLSSFKGEFVGDNGAHSSGGPVGSVDVHGIPSPSEPVVEIGTTADLRRGET